jgi:hypothetical protein
MGIHHRNDGQWERIEVRVFIARSFVLSKAKSLEETFVLIGMIEPAIGPWLNDNFKPGGEVELGQSFLEKRGLHAPIDENVKFAPT